MTVESHTSASVIQFPIGPEAPVQMDGRQIDITLSFDADDMETLWQTAQERGCTLPELIRNAAMMDAYR